MTELEQYLDHINAGAKYLDTYDLSDAAHRALAKLVQHELRKRNEHPLWEEISFDIRNGKMNSGGVHLKASHTVAENCDRVEAYIADTFGSPHEAAVWFHFGYDLQYLYSFDGKKIEASNHLRTLAVITLLHYGVTGEYSISDETKELYKDQYSSRWDAFDYIELPGALEGVQLKGYKNQNYRVKGLPEEAAQRIIEANEIYKIYRRKV